MSLNCPDEHVMFIRKVIAIDDYKLLSNQEFWCAGKGGRSIETTPEDGKNAEGNKEQLKKQMDEVATRYGNPLGSALCEVAFDSKGKIDDVEYVKCLS